MPNAFHKVWNIYSSVHFSINMFMIILISRNYVHCVPLFWSIHLDMQCINYSAGSLLLLQTRARNVQIFDIHRKKCETRDDVIVLCVQCTRELGRIRGRISYQKDSMLCKTSRKENNSDLSSVELIHAIWTTIANNLMEMIASSRHKIIDFRPENHHFKSLLSK